MRQQGVNIGSRSKSVRVFLTRILGSRSVCATAFNVLLNEELFPKLCGVCHYKAEYLLSVSKQFLYGRKEVSDNGYSVSICGCD